MWGAGRAPGQRLRRAPRAPLVSFEVGVPAVNVSAGASSSSPPRRPRGSRPLLDDGGCCAGAELVQALQAEQELHHRGLDTAHHRRRLGAAARLRRLRRRRRRRRYRLRSRFRRRAGFIRDLQPTGAHRARRRALRRAQPSHPDSSGLTSCRSPSASAAVDLTSSARSAPRAASCPRGPLRAPPSAAAPPPPPPPQPPKRVPRRRRPPPRLPPRPPPPPPPRPPPRPPLRRQRARVRRAGCPSARPPSPPAGRGRSGAPPPPPPPRPRRAVWHCCELLEERARLHGDVQHLGERLALR